MDLHRHHRALLDVLRDSLLHAIVSILAPRERIVQQLASARLECLHGVDGPCVRDQRGWRNQEVPVVKGVGSAKSADLLRISYQWFH